MKKRKERRTPERERKESREKKRKQEGKRMKRERIGNVYGVSEILVAHSL